MILDTKELQMLYQSVVKPFGHPDPVGFMVRAIMGSGGDPDYLDVDGAMGFMPMYPAVAQEMVGNANIASLQGNVTTALAMDQMFFQKYLSVDDMITAFEFGPEYIGTDTAEVMKFIDEVNDSRPGMLEILEPPNATVADVISIMESSLEPAPASTSTTSFVKSILKG